jgi:hypothetical protein
VLKLDGASGVPLWRHVADGTAHESDEAHAVAEDRHGDVVAVGHTTNQGTPSDFTVIKLDGQSGKLVWQEAIDGTASPAFDTALAVAIDPQGDVIAAGRTENARTSHDFTVATLKGGNGKVVGYAVVSGSRTLGSDETFAVTVDAAGDVLAAGRTENIGTSWCRRRAGPCWPITGSSRRAVR